MNWLKKIDLRNSYRVRKVITYYNSNTTPYYVVDIRYWWSPFWNELEWPWSAFHPPANLIKAQSNCFKTQEAAILFANKHAIDDWNCWILESEEITIKNLGKLP